MTSACIQDTLSSRAALGLPLGRVHRASKGILHTRLQLKCSRPTGYWKGIFWNPNFQTDCEDIIELASTTVELNYDHQPIFTLVDYVYPASSAFLLQSQSLADTRTKLMIKIQNAPATIPYNFYESFNMYL